MRRIVALALVAAACGGGGSSETTLPADATAILSASGSAMERLTAVRFEMRLSGSRVLVDRGADLALSGAVGEYAAPDSAKAVLTLETGGLFFDVGSVAIGPKRWATDPLTNDWGSLPDGTGINPAIIFDTDVGWKPLLTIDMAAADLLGLESLDGTDAYHLRGDVQGERVAVITAGLAGEQPITVDLWVDPGSGFVLRIEFATSAEAGQTDWSIRLSEFGEPVEVEPPI